VELQSADGGLQAWTLVLHGDAERAVPPSTDDVELVALLVDFAHIDCCIKHFEVEIAGMIFMEIKEGSRNRRIECFSV